VTCSATAGYSDKKTRVNPTAFQRCDLPALLALSAMSTRFPGAGKVGTVLWDTGRMQPYFNQ
jgi:hypothetical protein